jgi:hypothetical protein
MVDDNDIKDELDDAKQDLRDALHQINTRVEDGVAKLRPDRGIRKHPVTTACLAGALGFALGADSGEVTMIGLFVLGAAAVMAMRERGVDDSNEVEVGRI